LKEAARAADAAGLWVLNRVARSGLSESGNEEALRAGQTTAIGRADVAEHFINEGFRTGLMQVRELAHTFTARAEASEGFADECSL